MSSNRVKRNFSFRSIIRSLTTKRKSKNNVDDSGTNSLLCNLPKSYTFDTESNLFIRLDESNPSTETKRRMSQFELHQIDDSVYHNGYQASNYMVLGNTSSKSQTKFQCLRDIE